MIKSKKISGLPTGVVKQGKKEHVKSFLQKGVTKKPKPYPVPEEEDSFIPEDDSAEVKYITRKNKS